MNEKIVVIGSSNVDLIMQVPKFPRAGETVSGGIFTQTLGGKGANQAVAAAIVGGNVSFVSCLGTDRFAELFMEQFENYGIDTNSVFQESGVATGTAIILVDQSGENSIALAPGANFRLSERHIKKAQKAMKEADVILLQGELHPKILRYILKWTASHGKQVLLNLAPAQHLEKEYMQDVACLVVNEVEAQTLLNRNVQSLEEVQAAAEELSTWIKGGVIISLGERGSYVITDEIKELVPAHQVKVVDTTAAGDVFCGSLATALVEGKTVYDAIRFASAAAAVAVTRLGAQASVPTREEIEEMLAEQS